MFLGHFDLMLRDILLSILFIPFDCWPLPFPLTGQSGLHAPVVLYQSIIIINKLLCPTITSPCGRRQYAHLLVSLLLRILYDVGSCILNEEMSFVRWAAFLLIRGCSFRTCALLSWLCADMVHDEGEWGWQAAKCLFTCSWFANANAPVLDKWGRDAAITPRLTFSVCMRQRSAMELSHASRSGPHHYRKFFSPSQYWCFISLCVSCVYNGSTGSSSPFHHFLGKLLWKRSRQKWENVANKFCM